MSTKSDARGPSRAERLTLRAAFQAVFRRGKRVERPSLLVLWQRGQGPGQVGFAVSRRVGSAVRRNRAKRRLREAYRTTPHALPARLQLVVVAKEAAVDAPFRTLRQEMREALATVARQLGAPSAP